MTLDNYMTGRGVKGVDLAIALDISEASLARIRRGGQNISRDLIRRIVEVTNGEVTAEDLVFGGDDRLETGAAVALHPTSHSPEPAHDHGG